MSPVVFVIGITALSQRACQPGGVTARWQGEIEYLLPACNQAQAAAHSSHTLSHLARHVCTEHWQPGGWDGMVAGRGGSYIV